METFGKRIRVAMLFSGRDRTLDLAGIAGISVPMARRWMDMPEATVAAIHLARVSMGTGVKMYWLATGEGVPLVTERAFLGREREVLALADTLPQREYAAWIQAGKKLLKP
jgi:hypothetical protein